MKSSLQLQRHHPRHLLSALELLAYQSYKPTEQDPGRFLGLHLSIHQVHGLLNTSYGIHIHQGFLSASKVLRVSGMTHLDPAHPLSSQELSSCRRRPGTLPTKYHSTQNRLPSQSDRQYNAAETRLLPERKCPEPRISSGN